MKLINLTPHPITILRDCGNLIICPGGPAARVDMQRTQVADLDGIPVYFNGVGEVSGLPDPEPGTAYIVSLITAQACSSRTDLLVVDDLVRNADGTVIGCRSLATLHSLNQMI